MAATLANVPADRLDAIARTVKAAFPAQTYCKTCGAVDGARSIVHCSRGGLGADWDLGDVVFTLQHAKQMFWDSGSGDHDLLVEDSDGHLMRFQVPAP